jgi:hypothetical protein
MPLQFALDTVTAPAIAVASASRGHLARRTVQAIEAARDHEGRIFGVASNDWPR